MSRLVTRLLTVPAVAGVTLIGIWVSGGLITDDFTASMWLTAGWMTLAAALVVAVAVRSPAIRLPALAGYALAASAAAIYLGPSVLFDDVIDLGALKGNRGDQQYRIPDGVRLAGHTVVIWCRAFSAPFGKATLTT